MTHAHHDPRPLPDRRRFVVVGAGLAGAATAFHLRLAGVQDVLVLEREHVPGVHASGRNAAMLRESMEEAELQALAREGAEVLRGGTLAGFRATGGLLVGLGDEPVEARVPLARGRARFAAGDGIVDVAALLARYLRGAEVRTRCEVHGLHDDDGAVVLATSHGDVRAEVVVNAAGAWAGLFGGPPLVPRNRTLFVSEPDARIDPDWPFLWDQPHGYYLRPESGGWLLCACDERDATPGDYAEDESVLLRLGARLRRHQPGLGDLRIAHRWVGQRTFARDRLPVVGFDPQRPRLFHVAALGGHGVTLSWSVGRLAADALLGRRRVPPALDPGRFERHPVR